MKVEILGKLLILFLLVVLLANTAYAKKEISDTTVVKKVKVHSPHKATIYSACLPGLGQAYNKKYWKVPIVYLGFAAIGYFIDWNNDYYQLYSKAFNDLTDEDDETTSYERLEGLQQYINRMETEPNLRTQLESQLESATEYYRRNRDLLFISIFGFYAINIIDASVDAHFFDFDVSDDLTFQWRPSMYQFNNENIYCINCTIKF